MTLRSIFRRIKRFLKPKRKLRFTRHGRYFFGLSIAIGLAAMNTGNNLLYLVLAWMFSMIMASGALSEVTMRSLIIRRHIRGNIFANRPFLIEISLTNTKNRLASYSIEIEDLVKKQSLGQICYFLKIPPGRTQQTSYRHLIPTRGIHRITTFRVSTKFPFNFFKKSVDIRAQSEFVVLPEVYPVSISKAKTRSTGFSNNRFRGRSGDFYGLRQYRHGDDPRDIHWRSTAKTGNIVIREWEEEAQRKITILCDNHLEEKASKEKLENFEMLISHAASLAKAYIAAGYSVQLICRNDFLPHGSGPTHLLRILRTLALLESCPRDNLWHCSIESREQKILVDNALVASYQRSGYQRESYVRIEKSMKRNVA